jgi:hypothetical protein
MLWAARAVRACQAPGGLSLVYLVLGIVLDYVGILLDCVGLCYACIVWYGTVDGHGATHTSQSISRVSSPPPPPPPLPPLPPLPSLPFHISISLNPPALFSSPHPSVRWIFSSSLYLYFTLLLFSPPLSPLFSKGKRTICLSIPTLRRLVSALLPSTLKARRPRLPMMLSSPNSHPRSRRRSYGVLMFALSPLLESCIAPV